VCLLTIGIWLLLALAVIVTGSTANSESLTALVGIAALVGGVILPVVANYWRPLFFGWHRQRRILQARLMAEGVLTNDDLQKGARLVYLTEVKVGTERRVGSGQLAFLVVDGRTMNVLGEKSCLNSQSFRIIPGCTGKCSRCWVIWACGGDTFRIRAQVNDAERDFLVQCREGRTLREVARSTEMLEELVEIDGAAERATSPSAAAAPEA